MTGFSMDRESDRRNGRDPGARDIGAVVPYADANAGRRESRSESRADRQDRSAGRSDLMMVALGGGGPRQVPPQQPGTDGDNPGGIRQALAGTRANFWRTVYVAWNAAAVTAIGAFLATTTAPLLAVALPCAVAGIGAYIVGGFFKGRSNFLLKSDLDTLMKTATQATDLSESYVQLIKLADKLAHYGIIPDHRKYRIDKVHPETGEVYPQRVVNFDQALMLAGWKDPNSEDGELLRKYEAARTRVGAMPDSNLTQTVGRAVWTLINRLEEPARTEQVTDKDGMPLLDSDGNPRTVRVGVSKVVPGQPNERRTKLPKLTIDQSFRESYEYQTVLKEKEGLATHFAVFNGRMSVAQAILRKMYWWEGPYV